MSAAMLLGLKKEEAGPQVFGMDLDLVACV